MMDFIEEADRHESYYPGVKYGRYDLTRYADPEPEQIAEAVDALLTLTPHDDAWAALIRGGKMKNIIAMIAVLLLAVAPAAWASGNGNNGNGNGGNGDNGNGGGSDHHNTSNTAIAVQSQAQGQIQGQVQKGSVANDIKIEGDNTKVYAPAPSVYGPGLAAANCMGSWSVGMSGGNGIFGSGLGFGKTVESKECNRRAYADQLFKLAQEYKNPRFAAAGLALLANNEEVRDALIEVGILEAKAEGITKSNSNWPSSGGKDPKNSTSTKVGKVNIWDAPGGNSAMDHTRGF